MRTKQVDSGLKNDGFKSGVDLVQDHIHQLTKEADQLEKGLTKLNGNIEETRTKMQETYQELMDLEGEELKLNEKVEKFHKVKDSVKNKNRHLYRKHQQLEGDERKLWDKYKLKHSLVTELQSALKGGRYGPVKRKPKQGVTPSTSKKFKGITNDHGVEYLEEDKDVTAMKAKVSGQARATSLPSFKKQVSLKTEPDVKDEDGAVVKAEHEAEAQNEFIAKVADSTSEEAVDGETLGS